MWLQSTNHSLTHRERMLLVNPASSTITKQLVALVVGEYTLYMYMLGVLCYFALLFV